MVHTAKAHESQLAQAAAGSADSGQNGARFTARGTGRLCHQIDIQAGLLPVQAGAADGHTVGLHSTHVTSERRL